MILATRSDEICQLLNELNMEDVMFDESVEAISCYKDVSYASVRVRIFIVIVPNEEEDKELEIDVFGSKYFGWEPAPGREYGVGISISDLKSTVSEWCAWNM